MIKRYCFIGGSILIPLVLLAILGRQAQAASIFFNENRGKSTSSTILIEAVLYDGYEFNDYDEAVALRNVGQTVINLKGWRISDDVNKDSELLPDILVDPDAIIWIARDGDSFARQFGFAADVEISTWPGFANQGDEVILFNSDDQVVDELVYGEGNTADVGWIGPPVQPYKVSGLFGAEGQILYRKKDQISGLSVADTNSASDWAQDGDDPINGRKVRYPGWRLEDFYLTSQVTETAVLTISIAPDNVLETFVEAIDSATESIFVETFTFENIAISDALVNALDRGVDVKILLEGNPPGGISSQEKFICRQIEMSGGQCWFMISDADQRIHDRYRYLHSKFMLIDKRMVAVGSENLSPNSMPFDDKADGTWGRRGVVLWTDAAGIVNRVEQIFEDDLDPINHTDIFRWQMDHPVYGAPPSGFVPISESGGISYTVLYPLPTVIHGEFHFELQHAPENSLREASGLLDLVNRARAGDAVWVQQLVERPYWGPSNSNQTDDPNPRLDAYIAAARRGADVRLLLDAYFDNPTSLVSNHATCLLLNEIATNENLNLTCALGNPAGLGIHNKMVLIHVGGRGYVYVGSINGSELSNKGNREVALLVQSDGAYALLADMFVRDTPHIVHLPLIPSGFHGAVNHLLISEVLYDSYGQDDMEFIELVNPTSSAIDISGYGLGDALNQEDFEDLRRFPADTVAASGDVIVVTTSADSFWNEYGFWPDFEILETNAMVANLIDDPAWGDPATFLRLGNSGDEVILRDNEDIIVDIVTYGENDFVDEIACPLLSGTNHSLERFPYWQDTDNCPKDFRDWPFPSPGKKP